MKWLKSLEPNVFMLPKFSGFGGFNVSTPPWKRRFRTWKPSFSGSVRSAWGGVRHPPQTDMSSINQVVLSTHLKNIPQIGSFPQIGMKIKHDGNHHLDQLRNCVISRASDWNEWQETLDQALWPAAHAWPLRTPRNHSCCGKLNEGNLGIRWIYPRTLPPQKSWARNFCERKKSHHKIEDFCRLKLYWYT